MSFFFPIPEVIKDFCCALNAFVFTWAIQLLVGLLDNVLTVYGLFRSKDNFEPALFTRRAIIIYLTHYQTTKFYTGPIWKSADDNFKFDGNSRKFSKPVENTVGKGEIACYSEKACFPKVSKGVIVWEWVNANLHSMKYKQSKHIVIFLLKTLNRKSQISKSLEFLIKLTSGKVKKCFGKSVFVPSCKSWKIIFIKNVIILMSFLLEVTWSV